VLLAIHHKWPDKLGTIHDVYFLGIPAQGDDASPRLTYSYQVDNYKMKRPVMAWKLNTCSVALFHSSSMAGSDVGRGSFDWEKLICLEYVEYHSTIHTHRTAYYSSFLFLSTTHHLTCIPLLKLSLLYRFKLQKVISRPGDTSQTIHGAASTRSAAAACSHHVLAICTRRSGSNTQRYLHASSAACSREHHSKSVS
jgi:hypothetical protein